MTLMISCYIVIRVIQPPRLPCIISGRDRYVGNIAICGNLGSNGDTWNYPLRVTMPCKLGEGPTCEWRTYWWSGRCVENMRGGRLPRQTIVSHAPRSRIGPKVNARG